MSTKPCLEEVCSQLFLLSVQVSKEFFLELNLRYDNAFWCMTLLQNRLKNASELTFTNPRDLWGPAGLMRTQGTRRSHQIRATCQTLGTHQTLDIQVCETRGIHATSRIVWPNCAKWSYNFGSVKVMLPCILQPKLYIPSTITLKEPIGQIKNGLVSCTSI